MKEKILLIDGFNVSIAMNAVTHIEDRNTYPIGMYLGTLNQLRTFVDRFKPTKVVFVYDGPEAGERRRQIYPQYKGGRRMRARESKVQIMDGEDHIVYGVEGAFQNQMIKIFDFLKLLPVTVIMVPYCEADDVITYLALKNKEDRDCVIISNDKDYLQLIQPGIMVYRWKTKILYDQNVFAKEFNIKSENYIFRKIMLGDTGDKVDGVKGIGEKTFKRLEPLLNETVYNDTIDFVQLLKELDYTGYTTKEKNSFIKAAEEQETIDLAYKVMKLNEECLLEEQKELLCMMVTEQQGKVLSRLSAKLKMQTNCFNKLYNGFNDDKWLQTFAFLRKDVEIKC